MTFRLLIDECLSPELVGLAIAGGHVESTCVRNRGWAGTKDWQLIEFAVANDYTLVTHNSVDFRGNGPGNLGGEHAKQPIHAGLICLNSVRTMDLDRQCDLFKLALRELSMMKDLVNQALELFELEDGSIELEIYDIPEQVP
jgi:predicted nuclease of predicted toxin-antitoxin system